MADDLTLFGAPARRATRGRARRATDDTLAAMRGLGMVEPIDTALLRLAQLSADVLDHALADPEGSDFVRARAIAEHRATLDRLLALRSTADDADPLAELMRAVGHPPPD